MTIIDIYTHYLVLFFSQRKNPHDLIIKFGSYKENNVEQIIIHPNFYKTIDTLQHNIALLMLEKELPATVDLPCVSQSNIATNLCHVFSWSNSKFFVAMKMDNVEVFSKGECYTSHLILGKKHEKYVNKGINNVCVGNVNHNELNIVSFNFFRQKITILIFFKS